MVDCLQHRLDRGVEGEKVLHVLSRVAAAVPHAVLTGPLIPQKDQLEGQSLVLAFKIPEPRGAVDAGGFRDFRHCNFLKRLFLHGTKKRIGHTFLQ